MKFCTYTNSNVQNLIEMFTSSALTGNTLFGEIWSKTQNCQYKLKFSTYTNSNMQNSMVIFTFLFSIRNALY